MRRTVPVLAALSALCCSGTPAQAAPTGTPTVITDDIPTPWEVLLLPDGRKLVSGFESDGPAVNPTVRIFDADDDLLPAPALDDSDTPDSSRKFLGMARAADGRILVYETYVGGDGARSRIVSYALVGDALTDADVVFDGIGSDLQHDGGRMVIGPDDGLLYVTTGDMHDTSTPRNKDSLNGKILRMTVDGAPAPDNPFAGAIDGNDFVWSYGHRHPQGLAFDGEGRLWETEHGPSGEGPPGYTHGHDELNLIVKDGDYGWPQFVGDMSSDDIEEPKVHSGPRPAWALAGLAFSPKDGLLYAPALNGRHLHVFDTDGADLDRHGVLYGEDCIGRMRAATVSADGDRLWLTTDETPERVLRVGLDAGTTGIAWNTGVNQYAVTACTPPDGGGGGSSGGGGGGGGGSSSGSAPAPPAPAPVAPPAPLVSTPALPPPATPASGPAAAARLALTRTTDGLRAGRLARVLRLGAVSVRTRGFGRGTVRLQVKLGSLTVAQGVARPHAASQALTLRARLTRRGRAALRRRSRVRLQVRLSYTPQAGRPLVRSAAVTVRR